MTGNVLSPHRLACFHRIIHTYTEQKVKIAKGMIIANCTK